MPPFGRLMTDEQVAAVVNYIRTHFGNDYRRAGDCRTGQGALNSLLERGTPVPLMVCRP